MMNLRQMEVFHAIMKSGSVTGAARLLNVTQPAVSAVIKHCESQLGLKLFKRSGGRLSPTAEAHAIFPDIEGIFGRLEAVRLRAQDLAGGRVGALSIAGAFPIANGYLAKAVAEFTVDRPRVRVALHSLTSPQVMDRVVNREVELGVAYETPASAEVETEILVQTSITCVMRREHPLAGQDVVHVKDLESHAVITYLPQVMFRRHIEDAFEKGDGRPAINVQVGLSLTGMMLAYYGAGVALVEPFLLAATNLPGLVTRPLIPRVELPTLLISHRSAPVSKAMTDFVELLKDVVTRTDAHKPAL